MKAEDFLPIWMERGNMPTDEERIAEMRPSEWLRFCDAFLEERREQMMRDIKVNAVYEELAVMNGLVETGYDAGGCNVYKDKYGQAYKLTPRGFVLWIDK